MDNIDLWVGGMLEAAVAGGKVGPTFRCVIVEQMRALRAADRFWYENEGVWSGAQLREVRRTSLAALVCENGDGIERVQRDVFVTTGEMVECGKIERMSLEAWRDEEDAETCLREF